MEDPPVSYAEISDELGVPGRQHRSDPGALPGQAARAARSVLTGSRQPLTAADPAPSLSASTHSPPLASTSG